jgi:putative ABC transport system permease protein
MRNIRNAFLSLRESIQRAVLSALGIMIGTMAIVTLISLAKGVQEDVSRQVNDIGVNLLIVIPARIHEGSMFAANMMGISALEYRDVERVKKVLGVRRATPISFVGGGASQGRKYSETTVIVATEPAWFAIRPNKLKEGRYFDEKDADQPLCVLGSVTAHDLFGSHSAIGKTIEHKGKKYKVVGVTQEAEEQQSIFSEGGFENVVYVPYPYMRKMLGKLQINRIMIQTKPDAEPKSLVEAVDKALGERLNQESYSVLTQKDLLKLIYKMMAIVTWLLTGLTSIGLFVGGTGIMTVMLMSVNERAREIGIRKAFGATRRDLFIQFLSEAAMLSLLGGFAGIVLSYGVAIALRTYTPLKPMITPDIILLAISVCFGVGAVFGLIPAMRAARKDPIEALRHE